MNSKHPTKTVKRETLPKRIAALVKKGKLGPALKLARGWELTGDQACKIVEFWQAIGALEQEPGLEHGAPEGFCYARLFEGASLLTCSEVRRAVLAGDSEFFMRIAKRLKQAEPVKDDLRYAILSDALMVGGKTPKEIAFDTTSEVSDTTTRVIRRIRKEFRREDK